MTVCCWQQLQHSATREAPQLLHEALPISCLAALALASHLFFMSKQSTRQFLVLPAGGDMLRRPRALLPLQPARVRHHCRALPVWQRRRLGELCALGVQGAHPLSLLQNYIEQLTPMAVFLQIMKSLTDQ